MLFLPETCYWDKKNMFVLWITCWTSCYPVGQVHPRLLPQQRGSIFHFSEWKRLHVFAESRLSPLFSCTRKNKECVLQSFFTVTERYSSPGHKPKTRTHPPNTQQDCIIQRNPLLYSPLGQ
ncbi:hypothetical protein JOB18_046519 [Solea senegalensis]|uniref:Uncharacterized protein n=1 Tax=Solea senegalensis TaxID=28829 RepID=A0AAV6PTJ3_SOLSE|nr:hypothetical protein JOB18_046519 [Solea senegalensis]